MKGKQITIALFCISSFYVSCSNDSGNKDDTNAVVTDSKPDTSTAVATSSGDKKKEIAALGLKGKIEILTESVYKVNNGEKGNLFTKNIFKFNTAGDRIEVQNFKSNGTLSSVTKYTYDQKNHITTEEQYLPSGAIDSRFACKTDTAGRRIEQTDVTPFKTPFSKLTYKFKYDEKGNMTEWNCSRTIGTALWLYSYKYDDKGNRTEWITKATNGSIISKHIYRYDNNKNMIEEEVLNPDGTVKTKFTYRYQLDKKNNWIRQTKSENDKPVEIREREIKYF